MIWRLPEKSSRRQTSGIQVRKYLIINMENEQFFSFADEGIIRQFYDDIA